MQANTQDQPSIAICSMAGALPGVTSLREFFLRSKNGEVLSSKMPRGLWPLEEGSLGLDGYRHRLGFFLKEMPALPAMLEPYKEDLAGLDPLFSLTLGRGVAAFLGCKNQGVDLSRAGIILGNILLPTSKTSLWAKNLYAAKNKLLSEKVDPRNYHLGALPAHMLAHVLGFGGAVHTLDAACASSLYALKLAVDELTSYRADLMIAGGVSKPDSFYTQMGFSQLGAISPQGVARPFDGRGDGLLVGEGCGFFVLKRLSDAIASQDEIWGVIDGVGLSTDMDGSLLAPSSSGQLRAMKAAYENAHISPKDVDYIECHATGTPLGDAVEFASLSELFRGYEHRCVLSSAKANVGHMLTAAGAAGLIRVLYSMKEGVLPPTASFESPSSKVSLAETGFRILKEAESWERQKEGPRRAGVSGFGFGGINAHLLVSEYQPSKTPLTKKVAVKDRQVVVVGAARYAGDAACHLKEEGGEKTVSSFGGAFACYGDFRIPPKEILETLPQQLIALNVVKDAMGDAGLTLKNRPKAGAFLGVQLDPSANNFHARWELLKQGVEKGEADKVVPPLNPNRVMGALGGIVGSRVAREFRFGGCGYTVSSEENSGLTALSIAFSSIKKGELDEAVVAAVDLASQKMARDSSGASCYENIKDAACGLVLMEREEALAQQRPIYAEILDVVSGRAGHLELNGATLSVPDLLADSRVYLGAATGLSAFCEFIEGHDGVMGLGVESYGGGRVQVSARCYARGPSKLAGSGTEKKGVFVPVAHMPMVYKAPYLSQKALWSLEGFGERRVSEMKKENIKMPAGGFEGVWPQAFASELSYHTAAEAAYVGYSQKAMENSLLVLQALQSYKALEPGSSELPRAIEEKEEGKAIMLTPKGREPFNKEPCFLDFAACETLATGKIGDVLGPKFAPIDHHPTRVRLPEGPLLLCHRMMSIDATPLSMGSGRLVTEHDIHKDAWYLDTGRIPICVAVEAGQADLFLSGYLGIDFLTKGERVYRLLDAEVTFYSALPRPGKTIRYDIKIDHFFKQGDTTLFRFSFEASVDGVPLMSMRKGCAGFFSQEELDAGRGIVKTALSLQKRPGKKTGGFSFPLEVLQPESYGDEALDRLREGDYGAVFGEDFSHLSFKNPQGIPSGMMRLVHRVLRLQTFGGQFDLGFIVGEADIHPDDWFITCHFVDDKVMPGTLMYECCLHTLRIYLMRLGWVGEASELLSEPILNIASKLKCRGQVLSDTKKVTYEIMIREIGYDPDAYVICDALMSADGKKIVEISSMTLRHPGLTKEKVDRLWQKPAKKPRFDRDHVLAIAVGKPSDAFGEAYAIFDGDRRRCPRLPGPPFMFIDQVSEVTSRLYEMKAGGTLTAHFTPKEGDWYFAAEGGDNAMPFSVFLETPLQACGFYSTYMGSALTSDIDFVYRNLGGSGIVHKRVFAGMAMTSRIHCTKVSASGGMIIQDFDFLVSDNEGLIYEGTTTFGFFTKEAMSKQIGLRGEQGYLPSMPPQVVDLPYPEGEFLPKGQLRMIDTIEGYWPSGGRNKLGFAKASKKVNANEWFFKAHFYQDPVVPGSLGLESFLQVLKFMALEQSSGKDIRAMESVALATRHHWTYRGQVLPSARKVIVDVEVLSFDEESGLIVADGYLSVDGLMIYKMEHFSVRLIYG